LIECKSSQFYTFILSE